MVCKKHLDYLPKRHDGTLVDGGFCLDNPILRKEAEKYIRKTLASLASLERQGGLLSRSSQVRWCALSLEETFDPRLKQEE